MTSKILSLATVAVFGIIVADLVIHPHGTGVVVNGLSTIARNTGNQMLGYRA